MEMLSANFQKEYKPSSHVAVDESMILFKGRSAMKQYMLLKLKVKRRYKVWNIADSETIYLCKFDLYQGHTERRSTDMGLGEHAVHSLIEDVVDAGSQVFFDNIFFRQQCFSSTSENKVYLLVTFRSNNRDLTSEVKVDNKLQCGSFLYEIQRASFCLPVAGLEECPCDIHLSRPAR